MKPVGLDSAVIDVTSGFGGAVLGPVPLEDAAHRVLAYCTEPRSGWSTYDLAGVTARAAGLFEQVTSWSLFYANALNAQVTLDNVAAFDRERRRRFADRLAQIPADTDLREMHDAAVETVIEACAFGFPGVWGPKITKLGALYRPRSVPVLDGHVAEVFGFNREGFSNAAPQHGMDRRQRIGAVVRALAAALGRHQGDLAALRRKVMPTVPEIELIPDLRLLDMVIWTTQDDRMKRRVKQGLPWIDRQIHHRVPLEELLPEALIP